MTELRIVAGDVVELNGRPVAKLLPRLKLSLRDELAWAFDAVDEDYVVELETRIARLEERLKEPAR
jgi:hypothetical protein